MEEKLQIIQLETEKDRISSLPEQAINKIPSSVFRCDKFTILDLKSCKIILPVSFDGSRNLTTLRLHSITFENYNALETLINLCPLLEILDVRNLLGYRQILVLHAPNLQSLTINGSLSYLGFKETRMVTNAELILNPNEFLYDLTNVLNSLSLVHQLKFWSSGHSVFKEVVFSPLMIEDIKFNQLKKLFLGVNLDCSKETSIAFCILKNCPSLSHLQIYCEHLEEEEEEEDGTSLEEEEDGTSLEEEEDGTSLEEEDGKEEDGISLSTSNEFWNDQRNFSSSSFDNLKVFDITNVHGSKSELRFIKYILGKAPLLEVSNIKIDWKTIAFGERKTGDILIQLLSFERISSAKVIIDEPVSN